MTADLPTYEVLAVRFGSSSARPGSQNFIMPDGHDGPMQMDFYIWVIRREGRTIVVDTGFSPGASSRRNRQFVHAPAEALAQAGVNVLEYLVALQDHRQEVFANPSAWLPWNYEAALVPS